MDNQNNITQAIDSISEKMAGCGECSLANTERGLGLAGQEAIYETLDDLLAVLFPGCHGYGPVPDAGIREFVRSRLARIASTLENVIYRALHFKCPGQQHGGECLCPQRGNEIVLGLLQAIPEIQCILHQDIQSAYEGDPAARSNMEVVLSYPFVIAIATHRISHLLYKAGVPIIPRIMSERAHSRTGIDIHPGAEIGAGFFIDHGTGVVIGETCRIGDHVKLYQGVTLGALSFPKDDQGRLIKGIKRHPNVEDNVTIYAGATILGGNTTIGANSEIGGNVWLTHSVPAGSKVYNQQPRPLIRNQKTPGPEAAEKAEGQA